MKNTIYISLLLFFFPYANLQADPAIDVRTGVDISGGGNKNRSEGTTAWFLGSNKNITVCFESDPSFPVSVPMAQAYFEKAFASWDQYVSTHGINLLPSEYQFATTLNLISQCKGSEDLKIYLGSMNKEIFDILKLMQYTIAFVYKKWWNGEKTWSNGLIWVGNLMSGDPSPGNPPPVQIFEKNPELLQTVFLHEIGHLFGNLHTERTIMDFNLIGNLLDGYTALNRVPCDPGISTGLCETRRRIAIEKTRSIDQTRILDGCFSSCAYTFHGGILPGPGMENDGSGETGMSADEVFRVFTGVNPQGPVEAHFLADHHNGRYALFLVNGAQSFEIPIEFPIQGITPQGDHLTRNFERPFPDADPQLKQFQRAKPQYTLSMMGRAHLPGGEKITVLYVENGNTPAIINFWWGEDKVYRLFSATPFNLLATPEKERP